MTIVRHHIFYCFLGALFMVVTFFIAPRADAAVKTWDGGGGDNNWNTAANWNLDVAPVSTDTVVFDATSTKNATVNVAVTVAGFSIASGYTGIITASANVIVNGAFSQADGTVDLGSTTWTQENDWTYTAGTFTPSTSTVKFYALTDHTLTITGSQTFTNVTFEDSWGTNSSFTDANTIASGTTMTVTGTLTFTDAGGRRPTLSTGSISAQGAITITGNGFAGTAAMTINGTGDQTMTGKGSVGGAIPKTTINKTSGTLTFVSTITASNNWTYTAGTLSQGTSTIAFVAYADNTSTITGSHTLANVTFEDAWGTDASFTDANTIASGTTMTVTGTLTFTDAGGRRPTLGTGSISAQGAITITGNGFSGTTLVTANGTGDQTFTGTGSTGGAVPAFKINKTSGTLTLASTITASDEWTYTAGTLTPGSSTVAFIGYANNSNTITGSHTLANVTFEDAWGTNASFHDIVVIASGTTLTVTGTLTMTDPGGETAELNTGAITAQGDVTVVTLGFQGTATLTMSGTANQTLTGAGSSTTGDFLALTVNKSAGAVTVASTLRTSKSITITAGMFQHNPSAANALYFTGTGTVMTVGASGTWRSFATDTTTISLSGNVSNSGTVDFEARETCGGTDIVVVRSSSGGTQRSWSGSGTFRMYDVDLQDQGGSATVTVRSGTNTSGNGSNFTFDSTCPSSTYTLSTYRFFNNDNAVSVTSALAAADTASSAPAVGVPFRLRMLLHVGVLKVAVSGANLKLQVAARSGSCDTAYSGESYADVAAGSGDVRFYDNGAVTDATNLTANASLDPTHSTDTVLAETYEEANNFSNGTAAISIGQDGKWDFPLVVNTAGSVAYCFRVVQSDGTVTQTPTVVPEVGIRGSLYSQNHANTSGSLYIYGNYSVPASSTDYWSYATDFDSTNITGSERRAQVKLASGAVVSVPSGTTLQMIGGSGANQSTTVDWITSGGYTMAIAGTVNANYYSLQHLQGPNGCNVQSTATVTSLSNGTFDNLVGTAATDDAFLTLDATLIGVGTPTKTVSAPSITNTGSGAECNIKVSGSAQSGYWNISASTGAFAGEANDCEPTAAPGELRWVAGGYATSGYLISSTFDTQKTNGVAFNTLVWKGSEPTNTDVQIQLATSNSSSGPWSYLGSDCTSATYYAPAANTAVEIKCYTNHNNKRYFKYKVVLSTSDTAATPQVDDVVVNYSQ